MKTSGNVAVFLAACATIGGVLGLVSQRARTFGRPAAKTQAKLAPFREIGVTDYVKTFAIFGVTRLAVALETGGMEMYDVASGKCLWAVNGYMPAGLKFTRDGSRLISWDGGKAVVWNPATGARLAKFSCGEPLAWSASDRYFVARNAMGERFCYDANTGAARAIKAKNDAFAIDDEGDVFHSERDGIYGSGPRISKQTPAEDLAASPDGKTLAVLRSSGDVTLYQTDFDLFDSAPKVDIALKRPVKWMAWLQEGPLLLDTASESDKAEFTLIDRQGNRIASLPPLDRQTWVSAKGTLALETKDGKQTAYRIGSKITSVALDCSDADDDHTAVYGENLAAVASGSQVSFFNIPK